MALELAHDAFGQAGPPVVILHGLLGSARNWTGIAKELAATHRVFALDLRNHGRSPWAATMSFDEMAGDVAAFIGGHDLSPAGVIGHSLGGKVAMRLALTRPELVERLLVVDVAPVAYAHTFGPFIEAMRTVDLAAVKRRGDADVQLCAAKTRPCNCLPGEPNSARWAASKEQSAEAVTTLVVHCSIEGIR